MASSNPNVRRPPRTTHEGAPARSIDAEAELRRSCMACLLFEKTFYEEGEDVAARIARLVQEVPMEVAASIAIEARERMHLRHAPLWIVRAMARKETSSDEERMLIGNTLARVIQRADEMGEFLAMYFGGPDRRESKEKLSGQVKWGIAQAFCKFDEYALKKYNREAGISLKDVLFLTHPRPRSPEQKELWERLMRGELAPAQTWEERLSAGEDKRAVWMSLIINNEIGGLAFLRNIRNMVKAEVPEGLIASVLADEERAKIFRRVLPFRYIAAARYAPQSLEPYFESAMFRSLEGSPRLDGKTALVVDHSGSMLDHLSERSDMLRFDAACGLAMLLREVCEHVDVIAFSQDLSAAERHYYQGRRVCSTDRKTERDAQADKPGFALLPPRRGFALRDALELACPWMGTHTETAKQLADRRGYDRIILITDEQSHQAISAPEGRGYVINVGTFQNGIGYGKWTHIDGWSESVVRYIQEAEGVNTDDGTLVTEPDTSSPASMSRAWIIPRPEQTP